MLVLLGCGDMNRFYRFCIPLPDIEWFMLTASKLPAPFMTVPNPGPPFLPTPYTGTNLPCCGCANRLVIRMAFCMLAASYMEAYAGLLEG